MKFNKAWSIYSVTCYLSWGAFISLTLLFYSSGASIFLSFSVMNSLFNSLELVVYLDLIAIMFLFTVTVITSGVLLFSNDYMVNEKFFSRFHLILMSFVMSMILLILSPNMMSALIGWDGLGVSSFVLVVYYNSSKSYNAGMLTALTNRFGDSLMILSLVLLVPYGDLSMKWYTSFWVGESYLMYLIVVALFTKSAQIPFSAWLPAAMAAPTPVSSLVHSSTLVTAGVYLLIRHNSIFSTSVKLVISLIGVLTTSMASLSAFFESDMKKIVALSTLSQLGVMVVAIGVGNYLISFLHLLAHAYFKALLFVATGNFIHASDDYQSMKMTGAVSVYAPVSYISNMVCSLSLCGIPFMSAFFSKEPIIEICNEALLSDLIYGLMFLSIVMTVTYSVRLSVTTGANLVSMKSSFHLEEGGHCTLAGMVTLYPWAVLAGCVFNKWFASGPLLFHTSSPQKVMALLNLLLGLSLAAMLLRLKIFSYSKTSFFFTMWSLPFISSTTCLTPLLGLSKLSRSADLSWSWGITSNTLFMPGLYSSSWFNVSKNFREIYSMLLIWVLLYSMW